jgi:hypothetical protein
MELGPIQTKWIESLEKHPERQGYRELGRRNEGSEYYQACCLGEGGLIAGVCEWRDNRLYSISGHTSGTLSGDAYKALGLYSATGMCFDGQGRSLADLNDDLVPWPEIAAILRRNPEVYFKESI